jgi:hypothetical protein
MLNVGILYRSVEVIALLDEMNLTKERFLRNFPVYKYIESSYIFDVSINCGWIRNSSDDVLKPTERGYELLAHHDPVDLLRTQIKDVIKASPPTWLQILKQGRKQAKRRMSQNEIQCFENANLLEEFDFSIAEWWDELFIRIFEEDQKKRYKTGRKGEYLTLILEKLRTNKKATLVSLDVNFAGYDVLSQNSESDSNPLYLEVKSSKMNWNQATFMISRNEWDVLSTHRNSMIYLWCFCGGLLYSKITFDELSKSVPADQGIGRWRDVEIPFKVAKPIQNPFQVFNGIDQKTNEEITRILNEKESIIQTAGIH